MQPERRTLATVQAVLDGALSARTVLGRRCALLADVLTGEPVELDQIRFEHDHAYQRADEVIRLWSQGRRPLLA